MSDKHPDLVIKATIDKENKANLVEINLKRELSHIEGVRLFVSVIRSVSTALRELAEQAGVTVEDINAALEKPPPIDLLGNLTKESDNSHENN